MAKSDGVRPAAEVVVELLDCAEYYSVRSQRIRAGRILRADRAAVVEAVARWVEETLFTGFPGHARANVANAIRARFTPNRED